MIEINSARGLLALVLATSAAARAADGPNLVANPGFESYPLGNLFLRSNGSAVPVSGANWEPVFDTGSGANLASIGFTSQNPYAGSGAGLIASVSSNGSPAYDFGMVQDLATVIPADTSFEFSLAVRPVQGQHDPRLIFNYDRGTDGEAFAGV